jgi:hypothetical protein
MHYYEVQGNYGQGYECVTAEDTRPEALARLKEYRENEPGTAFRIVRKKEETNGSPQLLP